MSMEVIINLEKYFNKIVDVHCAGIHLTSNAYVATHLLKDLTATEYTGELDLGKLFKIKQTETNNIKSIILFKW